jgi:hypothetical protein
MSVSPVTLPVGPAEQLMGELETWRLRFERGELRPAMPGRPALAADERFAVDLGRVRAAGLGRRAAGGILHATDRRLVVLGRAQRPLRTWRLAELGAVRALGNWGGLTLVHAGGETELVVTVGSEAPCWGDAAGWLKVEAAFAAAGERLAQWAMALPERLTLAGIAYAVA